MKVHVFLGGFIYSHKHSSSCEKQQLNLPNNWNRVQRSGPRISGRLPHIARKMERRDKDEESSHSIKQ